MPHQAPLLPGDPRRVGRYRLAGRIIGIPADGPIYLGTGQDGAEVMISMLGNDWAHDGAARDRFAAEAAVAKRVPPFCAARILDAGVDASGAYLISDYVPGKSLMEIVSADGVLDQAALEAVAVGMATGLACVHQAGLVHGSFGPEFVIMTTAGPRVVEFGITPPYGAATPSADMVAWAQTVVFAATGRPPAAMADLDGLPYYIKDLVVACLNPDPSERPTARATVMDLIGDHDPPAGVLAEGSRRAIPGAGHVRRQPPRPAAASVRPRSGQLVATGQLVSSRPSGSRSVSAGQAAHGHPSRHGRGAADVPHPTGRGGPHPDRHGAHQQSRRWRRAPLIVGILIVGVLIAVALPHLLGGKSKPQASTEQRANSRHAGAGSPPASESASPRTTTPPSFGGHWSGQLSQPPSDLINVSLSLASGASTGSVTYSPVGITACSATLSLISASSTTLTLSQGAIQGQSCSAGTVTMTLTGSGTVDYTFRGSGPAATGTLTRS